MRRASKLLFFTFFLCFFSSNAQNLFFEEIIDYKNSKNLSHQFRQSGVDKVYKLEYENLKLFLDNINFTKSQSSQTISIPNAEGDIKHYQVTETSVMESGFKEKYTDIRTFKGFEINNPHERIRFSLTTLGFEATIVGSKTGIHYIKPINASENLYISYDRKSLDFEDLAIKCYNKNDELLLNKTKESIQELNANDGILRTYRLAVSATGEYSSFYNNNLSDIISAIAIAVNNANEILERDLSVSLKLIDNTSLIFLNASTDPFSNFDNLTILDENQLIIDDTIGENNYDIGHVFNTAGGGRAFLSSTCVGGLKAKAVSGNANPDSPPFINTFLHEIGHQFGSPHTFNGSQGQCESNRNNFTAFEPGSGSTIMAYQGFCLSQNLNFEPGDDSYYHQISLELMWNHISNSGDCPPNQVNTGNSAPIASAGENYVIPKSTPYKLTGSSSDPDGTSTHTYTWEQFDLGPTGAPTDTTAQGPLIRSIIGTDNPTRFIPNLNDLMRRPGSQPWEKLVSVDRNINFILTVRDNDSRGGQIAVDAMNAIVTSEAGPFKVTSQNILYNIVWEPGSTETITWDVAGTDGNGINTQFVNVLLSTNAGESFDIVLLENTPNDGSQIIEVPNVIAEKCRIMLEAVDNIFFNINEAFFAIGEFEYDINCIEETVFINRPITETFGTTSHQFEIGEDLMISDLDFSVDITGEADNSSLSYQYRPPNEGRFIPLATNICENTTDVNITFDDEGLPLDCNSITLGENIMPEEPLSVMDGKNAKGFWRFTIKDDVEDGKVSKINFIKLKICSVNIRSLFTDNDTPFIDFIIFPNPAKENFNIQLNTESSFDIKIEIIDLAGRIVYENKFKPKNDFLQTISSGNIPSGTYLVRVTQNNRLKVKKLLVN